ncbi:protein TBRG4-like [Mizuhopecten yessoensis]|uniref:Protein TBRG4 n=1 Tax=Mizuhopecten yessoensis TaxID=6573 RepID=A0A210PLP9_MIZYE|nr:protein TBRG4-like [Mizuhopecten yessoensis]OWF37428.1 Protein TBRG4 [Mizuhopecten yessoensis]
MQSLHILRRSFQAFRRIGAVPVYRLRTAYPCVQLLNYSGSPATTVSSPDELSSQARILVTLKSIKEDLNTIEASDEDKSEKQNARAHFICEQLQKLLKSNREDKISANGIHAKQVQQLFRSIKSDANHLSAQNVIECVAAYVQLSLAVCCNNEAERNDCLNLEEYCKFEVQVKDNLDSTSLQHLVMLYNTFFECRLRHPQTVIFYACEKLLRERVPKVTQLDELISLCELVNDSDQKQLWESVENRVSLFSDKMSIQQLTSCLHSLVNRKSPSKASRQLHSKLISQVLEHEAPSLQVRHLSFITWTMKKVGVPDAGVLQKLCEKIMQTKSRRNNDKSGNDTLKLCYLLSNLDRFQWAQKDVFDLVVARLLNLHSAQLVDPVRLVLINAANLNIRLAESQQLIKRHITSKKKVKDVYERVHLLWAFSVMGKQGMVSKEIEDLFNPNLLKSVEEDKPLKVLKLLKNLRDIAMTVDKPLGSLTFLCELKRLEKQRKSSNFENGVYHIIENNLPEGSYCKNVITPAGHKIDIELYVNDRGEAVAMKDQTTGIHRIALKTRGYFTMSKPNNLPLGWVMMENRNLVKEGYTLLEIPHYEWLKHSTSETRLVFINERIKEAVQSKTQTDTSRKRVF